jgi:hypothetical protein
MKVIGVTGKVIDEGGEGLPGVNLLVKGTIVGTTTAGDSTYSLKPPVTVYYQQYWCGKYFKA